MRPSLFVLLRALKAGLPSFLCWKSEAKLSRNKKWLHAAKNFSSWLKSARPCLNLNKNFESQICLLWCFHSDFHDWFMPLWHRQLCPVIQAGVHLNLEANKTLRYVPLEARAFCAKKEVNWAWQDSSCCCLKLRWFWIVAFFNVFNELEKFLRFWTLVICQRFCFS